MSYTPLPLLGVYNCTYTNSFASNPPSNDAGWALGLAFSSIQEANQNWNNQKNNALASGNYWALPNGSHNIGDTKVIKSGNCIRYENPATGQHYGVTSDGKVYNYSG